MRSVWAALGVWSKAENEQFLGSLMCFGQPPNWELVREHYPSLSGKTDSNFDTHFALISKQLNQSTAEAKLWSGNPSVIVLDPAHAHALRERINFLFRLRNEVLRHPEFEARIACAPRYVWLCAVCYDCCVLDAAVLFTWFVLLCCAALCCTVVLGAVPWSCLRFGIVGSTIEVWCWVFTVTV